MSFRSAVSLVVLALAVTLTAQRAPSRNATKTAKPDLPPLSYVCPMPADADVIDDKPGWCPRCGMTLQPIRLVSVWTCDSNPGLVVKDGPGRCPADGTELVRMTMAVSWTCSGDAKASVSPGTCSDGTPMKAQYELRPHGNHNPQHGGQFFMASDNWHHLEGTYPLAGIFRMYLYDDYAKPLAREKQKAVTGIVVVNGQSIPLAPAPNGRYLEAKIGTALPAVVEANVKFTSDGKSNVFDFNFGSYSKDPGAAPVGAAAPNTATATPVAPPAAAPIAPPLGAIAPTGVDPALIALQIPEAVPDILTQLRARTDQIAGLIDKGLFADIYVPAFQAKDLALALEAHQSELPPEKQLITEAAIAKLVRAAYLLDAFGDLGNKQEITAAYALFESASKDILSTFPSSRR